MDATQIGPLCATRGWTRPRLIHELRRAARERSVELPGDDSLRRMIREWVSGRRGLSEFYADLFTAVFGVVFAPGTADGQAPNGSSGPGVDGVQEELVSRLNMAAAVDLDLVQLLEAQTHGFRLLDRQLGARRLLEQIELHLAQIMDLLAYCVAPGVREPLAGATAEVAALAGWQALDLGDPHRAWRHHEVAKAVARDSEDAAIVAHVTAQQGYALMDVGRDEDAVSLMRQARTAAGTRVPAVLQSWLWCAEAEALANIGQERAVRTAMDQASRLLPQDGAGSELPYVVLDETHLARWRGNCLTRLGSTEAIDDLTFALQTLDPTFTRAAAALHCDLAVAYSMRGEHDAALDAAHRAMDLATRATSVRQRRRLAALLATGTFGATQREHMQHGHERSGVLDLSVIDQPRNVRK